MSCKLIHGDCLVEMDWMIARGLRFNLILVDPPYGQTQNPIDKKLPLDELWARWKHLLADKGSVVVFGQGMFTAELMYSNPKWWRYNLIWDKILSSHFLSCNSRQLRCHEDIVVFYPKQPVYHPQFTVGKPLHSKGVSYKEKEPVNNNYGKFYNTDDKRAGSTQKYPTSILRFQKPHPSKARHTTEKSVDLLMNLIMTYTNEGDTVLDCCAGSGSTIIAALRTNRNAVGIEINETYYRVMCERVEEVERERKSN